MYLQDYFGFMIAMIACMIFSGMVCNDVSDDMVASKLGMKVFLLTDCMINRKNEDISVYPHGGVDELLSYIENLKGEN